MSTLKKLVLMVCIATASACSLTPNDSNSGWFIRSEFTWWEPKPEYELKFNQDNTLAMARFTLVPDGGFYHIKIADKGWSKTKNCGSSAVNGAVLPMNTWAKLECDYPFESIMPLNYSWLLKPKATSEYEIIVQFVNDSPTKIKLVTR